MSSLAPEIWKDHIATNDDRSGFEHGTTFLSIYSEIHVRNQEEVRPLTATASIHNPNMLDTIYVETANYYNTKGVLIRTYFPRTVFIRPMETVQIVIDGIDSAGGTGANFIFEWARPPGSADPVMEAVMISPYGQPAISFTTSGKRL